MLGANHVQCVAERGLLQSPRERKILNGKKIAALEKEEIKIEEIILAVLKKKIRLIINLKN